MMQFVAELVQREPDAPSSRISSALVERARLNDCCDAKDDITAGVVHFRRPRKLLILTGPPFDRDRDRELAELANIYPGRKAICGGTTANIVERILHRPIAMDLTNLDPEIPPRSIMQGVDLVTEGTLTLGRIVEMLERTQPTPLPAKPNAADELVAMMLASDVIDFVVGTRINQAHQDPSVPVELRHSSQSDPADLCRSGNHTSEAGVTSPDLTATGL